jgi:NAD(P)H-flavin reductase
MDIGKVLDPSQLRVKPPLKTDFHQERMPMEPGTGMVAGQTGKAPSRLEAKSLEYEHM